MASYIESLYEDFKDVKFELVHFDNGATPESMECYLLASNIPKDRMKNKGQTALDLGNYIYRRFGFIYETPPEYHRSKEPANSLAFYQCKRNFESNDNSHIREWIFHHDPEKKRADSVLYNKRRLEIPHVPPYQDFAAIWEKTGEIVVIRKGQFTEVIFEADKKYFKYLQAELGPESDFTILGEL